MEDNREYKINIDARILELLGPSLYTNIYYVLAELIANAYDANANNVYIIKKSNSIIVEDDGEGMSYSGGGIDKYLNVARETRTSKNDIFTSDGKRKKIGRKGIGKLAALAVSESVKIMTKKDEETSGFILSRHINKDNKLQPIKNEDVHFEFISKLPSGTSVVMTKPQYELPKSAATIKRNLLKIFPLVNKKFIIHINTEKDSIVIDSFDREIVGALGALITLGDEYSHLAKYFDSQFSINKPQREKQLLSVEKSVIIMLPLKNKEGIEKKYNLEIKGWVGIYRSTKGRKADRADFPDNFISLLSNGKLGEYNILPIVGTNKLQEVFVVGQLHVDIFEDTELPDMALSNRQGYLSDDLRYKTVIDFVRSDLLPRIVKMRTIYARFVNDDRNKTKYEQQKKQEGELVGMVKEFKVKTSERAAIEIAKKFDGQTTHFIQNVIQTQMNKLSPIIGLKKELDFQKKKILISHARVDKDLSDVVYKMLIFNNIPDIDIIYTSSDNENSWIPEDENVFEYLREFFVDSISNEKIYVIYVTSKKMSETWFAVTEVGAVWITKKAHKIFNLQDHVDKIPYVPKKPLNTDVIWQTSERLSDNSLVMRTIEFKRFIVKILNICTRLDFVPKTYKENEKELLRYINIKP